MTAPAVLDTALAAARAGDRETLCQLVDWTLSGAGRMSRALHGVDEADRAAAAAQGLAEMAAIGPGDVAVGKLAAGLATTAEVRPASEGERAAALEVIQVAAPATGLTPEQSAELISLAADVARFDLVWVAVLGTGGLVTFAASDAPDRLVLCGWPRLLGTPAVPNPEP